MILWATKEGIANVTKRCEMSIRDSSVYGAVDSSQGRWLS